MKFAEALQFCLVKRIINLFEVSEQSNVYLKRILIVLIRMSTDCISSLVPGPLVFFGVAGRAREFYKNCTKEVILRFH